MINSYYDFSTYEWTLKLKTKNEMKGFFVEYTIKTEKMDFIYPPTNGKKFAFCPTEKIFEFNEIKDDAKSIIEYVEMFNREEIELLNATIPLHN